MKSSPDPGVNATSRFVASEVVHMLNSDALSPEDFDFIMKRRHRPTSLGDLMRLDRPWRSRVWDLPQSQITVARLRHLVDDWISTGVRSDGVDQPLERKLIRTRDALAAVKACAATNPCKLHLLEKSAELVVIVGVPPAPPTLNFIDPLAGVMEEADRVFTSMMTNEWKYAVCKCRHCGRYFLREKLRRSYLHGMFCSREHQRHASALTCTNNRRSLVRQELIDFAARWLLKRSVKDRRWEANVTLKNALAGAISVKLSRSPVLRVRQQGVKVNWVTWNAPYIEKRRQELVTSW